MNGLRKFGRIKIATCDTSDESGEKMTEQEMMDYVNRPEGQRFTFDELKKIIAQLRAENGCPWDRKQTHKSLRDCMLEEAYETVDAIDNEDSENLKEELGDMLLQIYMHAQISSESGDFEVEDIVDGIARKMIRRHPHVFGHIKADTADVVLENWDAIKKEEKGLKSAADGLRSVAKALPANVRAAKVQKKAAAVGYDFSGLDDVKAKVYEELKELEDAVAEGSFEQTYKEFGDVMFSMVNLARFLDINAENSLTNATEKFINRLGSAEILAKKQGLDLAGMTAKQLDKLWEAVKEHEKDL